MATLRDRRGNPWFDITFASAAKAEDSRHRLNDKRIARIVRACQDLPGQEVFQYVDEADEVRKVTSEDVNEYLSEITGEEFTAKDFRTWAGTAIAFEVLCVSVKVTSLTVAKRNIVAALD
jgi:DNA topoisomerase-1